MHHKKGQPSAATSHESRPGKPSCCILGFRTSHTRWGKTDNSDTQGLASPWDHILTPAHDATQRRGAATSRRAAGLGAYGVTKIFTGTNSSAQDSDPQASKQPPRGHGLRDGSMGAMPIHIYGKHSPPFLPMTHDTATHATRQRSLHPEGLMVSPPLAHMYQRQPARYHSLGDGHVQAHSVFGPELGTGQQQLYAWHGTPSKSAAKVIQPQPPALPPEAWPCETTQTRPNSQREIRSS